MRKSLFLLCLVALVASIAMAQPAAKKYRKSQLAVGLRGGIGEVLVHPASHVDVLGTLRTNIGATVGLDANYAYFFNETVGLVAGLGASYMGSSLSDQDVVSNPQQWTTVRDADGTRQILSHYRCVTSSVEERYKMVNVEVPLMLALQGNPLDIDIRRYHKCFVAFGVRVVLPITFKGVSDFGTSTMAMGTSVTGADIQMDVPMPVDGIEAQSFDYDVKPLTNPLCIMASLETGMVLDINSVGSFLVALYADCALNRNSLDNAADSYVLSSSGDAPFPQGYLSTARADWLRCFRVGLKVQYLIGF